MPIPKSTISACSLSASSLPSPRRMPDGRLRFAKCIPEFAPNLSPEEVLRLGSFGGGYFRDIQSEVTGKKHVRTWEELPPSWLDGLDIPTHVASETYRREVNQYGVRCGVTLGKGDPFGLLAWEEKGWMSEEDPYGWFQWYCRFFLGRRSDDDDRQIGRWLGVCGAKGRWKNNLIAQCVKAGKAYDDVTVSPVVRQTLQHWAYRLSQREFDEYAAKVRAGAKTAFIPGGRVLAAEAVEPSRTGQDEPLVTAEKLLGGEKEDCARLGGGGGKENATGNAAKSAKGQGAKRKSDEVPTTVVAAGGEEGQKKKGRKRRRA